MFGIEEQLSTVRASAWSTIELCKESIGRLHYDTEVNSLVRETIGRLSLHLDYVTRGVDCTIGVELQECAQILMRSSFEAAGKILFISLQPKETQTETAQELITILSEIYHRRNKERAGHAANFAKTNRDDDSAIIYEHIAKSPDICASTLTRSERKIIEQKWSFTTIISWTQNRFCALGIDFPFSSILYDYGMSSHLLHADGIALDLELDQATRPVKEAEIKILLKLARSTPTPHPAGCYQRSAFPT